MGCAENAAKRKYKICLACAAQIDCGLSVNYSATPPLIGAGCTTSRRKTQLCCTSGGLAMRASPHPILSWCALRKRKEEKVLHTQQASRLRRLYIHTFFIIARRARNKISNTAAASANKLNGPTCSSSRAQQTADCACQKLTLVLEISDRRRCKIPWFRLFPFCSKVRRVMAADIGKENTTSF